MQINILDIDLDFFVEEIYFNALSDSNLRVRGDKHRPWSKKKTIDFLENNCGLDKKKKIKGEFFVHHDAVFESLRKIILENKKNTKFRLIHVDGHADLGAGDLDTSQYTEIPEVLRKYIPVALEPKIRLNIISYNNFFSPVKFDYVFLTQSPGFTTTDSCYYGIYSSISR